MGFLAAINFLMFALAGLLLVGAINHHKITRSYLEEARKLATRSRLRGRR